MFILFKERATQMTKERVRNNFSYEYCTISFLIANLSRNSHFPIDYYEKLPSIVLNFDYISNIP